MRGQKRSKAEAARAVGLAEVVGISEAARQMDLPRTTVQEWYLSNEFVELRQRTKEEVTGEWWAGVQTAFRRSIALLDETNDPVKAATAGAIIFDKMALSRGEVTQRSEVTSFSGTNDHERRAIAELLRESLAGDDAGGEAGVSEQPTVERASTNGATPA